MNIKVKNGIFITMSIFIIFLILEIICSVFFVYNSRYHGPLIKIFSNNTESQLANDIQAIQLDKSTNKMLPGTYEIDGVTFNINSKGFRGKEFDLENKNTCRIISFGGSVTLGFEKAYPAVLETKLKKNEKNCESLNFGMVSKSLNYIEDLMINEAIKYSPNIITIMTNRNSTMYDSYGSSSITPDIISNNFDFYIYKINKYLFSKIMTYRFVDLSYRRMVSWLYKAESKIVDPYNPKAFHLINYFEFKYINQITNIINFCKKNNIKVILIKEAYYLDPDYQKSLKNLNKEELLTKLINYHKQKGENKEKLFWMYTNAILNNALDEVKKQNPDIIVVDPTDKLYMNAKNINFTNDGNHLTNSGHEIVANEIYNSIIKNLNL